MIKTHSSSQAKRRQNKHKVATLIGRH